MATAWRPVSLVRGRYCSCFPRSARTTWLSGCSKAESSPLWGYEVEQGATTIWERWDSYTKEQGFGKTPP